MSRHGDAAEDAVFLPVDALRSRSTMKVIRHDVPTDVRPRGGAAEPRRGGRASEEEDPCTRMFHRMFLFTPYCAEATAVLSRDEACSLQPTFLGNCAEFLLKFNVVTGTLDTVCQAGDGGLKVHQLGTQVGVGGVETDGGHAGRQRDLERDERHKGPEAGRLLVLMLLGAAGCHGKLLGLAC
ncbi:hypothetical protein EYF80_053782 [Liparis tanakae]|uniref:Uncharacterized protein n=1 Tax=Liparis tanakae TaxID=230148 RepID=A0A4Z2F5M3_9TELE|nr:hypothetical protein EYF80_053782 [Liparis tanakae]